MVTDTQQDKKIVGWESPEPIHPGEHLADFLEDYDISQAELSNRTGLSKKAINEIVRGKSPLTQNTAFRLSKVFSVSPDFWVNLQNNYDTALARLEEEKRLSKEAEKYLADYRETYRELAKRDFIKPLRWTKSNYTEIVRQLQNLFAVGSLAYVENRTMGFAFRKHNKNINRYSLAAWVQLGEIKAANQDIAPFNKEKLKKALPRIKSLSLNKPDDYLPKLERILAECGVVLVYAPHFKNVPAQGAVKWVNSEKVLLMLNADNQYEDRFWFNLFHEIGHILLHSKKKPYVDYENGANTEEEEEADTFAKKQLIPQMDQFFNDLGRAGGDLKKAIERFADRNGISPSIVAGRLTYEFKDESQKIYPLMSPFMKERITYFNLELNIK